MPSGEAPEGFFMRPPKDFPANTAERMRFLLRRAKDIAEQRRIQAVLMRASDALRPTKILDGAGRHKTRSLPLPERLRLWLLPPYCPECNPSEHIWDEIRGKGFANQLFATLFDV
jgi:transposase